MQDAKICVGCYNCCVGLKLEDSAKGGSRRSVNADLVKGKRKPEGEIVSIKPVLQATSIWLAAFMIVSSDIAIVFARVLCTILFRLCYCVLRQLFSDLAGTLVCKMRINRNIERLNMTPQLLDILYPRKDYLDRSRRAKTLRPGQGSRDAPIGPPAPTPGASEPTGSKDANVAQVCPPAPCTHTS